jgi:uncharacterized membrane protein required for colicin V production
VPTSLVPFSWFDLAAGLAGLLIVANAARRGFMREGSLLLGLGLALWLAGQLHRPVGRLLLHQERNPAMAVGLYVVLVLGMLVAVVGLSALAAPIVRGRPFRGLDRLAGAGVGLAEATLLLGLLGLATERLAGLRPASGGLLARAAELVGRGFAWASTAIPGDVLGALSPR